MICRVKYVTPASLKSRVSKIPCNGSVCGFAFDNTLEGRDNEPPRWRGMQSTCAADHGLTSRGRRAQQMRKFNVAASSEGRRYKWAVRGLLAKRTRGEGRRMVCGPGTRDQFGQYGTEEVHIWSFQKRAIEKAKLLLYGFFNCRYL